MKDALAESEGAFISTASVAGVKPSGSSVPYAVTKAAQIHLMKSLAVILAPKIRVNSVSPGMLLVREPYIRAACETDTDSVHFTSRLSGV